MRFLSNVLTVIQKKYDVNHTACNNVFYKIVGSDTINGKERYKIQCINTYAVFQMCLDEIINDAEILQRLHPVQACYLGIEYAKNPFSTNENILPKKHKQISTKIKLGDFYLKYQDRHGKVCFFDTFFNKDFFMDPKDIALSDYIEKFNAQQAFQIGIMAGQKIKIPIKNIEIKKPLLRVVK